MQPINYLSLFVTFIIALTGLLVLKRDSKKTINRVFSLLTSCLAFWVFCNFMIDISTTENSALLWGKAVIVGPIFGPPLFVLFSYIFPSSKVSIGKLKQFLIFIPALLLVSLSPTTLNIKKVIITPGSVPKVIPGFLYPMFFLYFLFYVGWTIFNLTRSFKLSSGRQKMQLIYVFFGLFSIATLGLITNIVFVLLGNPDLPSVGPPLYTPIFVVSIAYAIVKHRLMDIRLLVLKSVTYSLLLAIIAGIYVGGAFYIKRGYETFIDPNILFVIAGFLLVLGFQSLRVFIEKYTDKIFAKGRYSPQELHAKLGEIATSTLKLKPMASEILKTIVTEMRIAKAALVLIGNTTVTGVKAVGYEKKSDLPWQKITGLVSGSRILLADELEEESKDKCILRELEIALLLPLQIKKETVAILTLGEKRSGDMYTREDIKFLEVLAPELAISIRNAELLKETEQRVVELNALNKMAISLTSTLGLENLLGQAIEQALIVTKAESGSIMLVDEKTQTLSIQAARGVQPSVIEEANPKVGEGVAGWVAKTGEPLILAGAEDERFKDILRRAEILSALSVPLKAKNKVIGVLNVNRKIGGKFFTKEDLKMIITFAAQVAAAIENAKLYEDLQDMFMGTISALASAVDAKDPYTYGHSQAVTEYAVATAKELSLSQAEIETIRLAGTLHDIGKIGIESEVLNKPGSLTTEERKLINLHPVIGVDILKSLDFLKNTLPLVYYHHEHWDGTGYPRGRKGKDIPIGARIIAVADAFNAMISERPYRPAKSFEDAIEELKVNAGSQFDPQVVQAFLKVAKRFHSDLDFRSMSESRNHVRKP